MRQSSDTTQLAADRALHPDVLKRLTGDLRSVALRCVFAGRPSEAVRLRRIAIRLDRIADTKDAAPKD